MSILHISLNLLILILLTTTRAQAGSTACEKKVMHLTALDISKELISKAKELQPSCVSDSKDVSPNSSECGEQGKVSAYLDFARDLIEDSKKSYTACGDVQIDDVKNDTKVALLHENPIDCSEILENGEVKSGKYKISPKNSIFNGAAQDVYCDMDTDGGGWTVIQRRGSFANKIDFYRDWNSYKHGFGNISEEFWIGNDIIYALTNQGNYAGRFDMQNADREYRFATYSSFRVGDEASGFKLTFDKYFGTAGDGISKIKNMKFSTKDKENNRAKCAALRQGGWWYNYCGDSNPNGIYNPELRATRDMKYMNWFPWTKYDSLLTIEIKIRQMK